MGIVETLQFILLLALFFSLIAISFLLTRKVALGKKILLGCLISSFFWTLIEFFLALDFPLETKLLLNRIQYFFIATTPLLYFLYAVLFLEWTRFLRPRNIAILCFLPLIIIISAWTNDFHHLIWYSRQWVVQDGVGFIFWTHGPLFYVYLVYCYLLICSAGIACIRNAQTREGLFRSHLMIIALSALIPIAANIVYVFHGLKQIPVDFTPIAFSLSILVLSMGFLFYRLLDLRPIAREVIFQGITDGLMVVNRGKEIVHMNRRMKTMLNLKEFSLAGSSQDLLFGVFPELKKEGPFAGLTVFDPVYNLYYDVSKTDLKDRNNRFVGELYLFRDITQRKELEQELKTMAQEDPLTGLLNRRSFFGRMDAELDRVDRYGSILSFLMIDLDHFKQVNDNYGHQAGDRVLEEFGKNLRDLIRSCDIAGRLGGEEFGILLPGADLPMAASMAERLRSAWENTAVIHNEDSILSTISIGYTQHQESGERPEALFKRADEALYEAKRMGRNRSVASKKKP